MQEARHHTRSLVVQLSMSTTVAPWTLTAAVERG
jgi:hypothetical protein